MPANDHIDDSIVPDELPPGSADVERVRVPEHHLFGARAEYHPDSEIPLHITLDVPEEVLDDVGGWDELVDTARLYHDSE